MPIAETDTVSNLLIRARGGDQDALERLFEVCRNYVNLLAQAQAESWLQAKVDASDIAQQTMLEAYRDFIGFEGRTKAEWLAWLRRILARNVTDFIRQFRGAKRQINREVGLHKQLRSMITSGQRTGTAHCRRGCPSSARSSRSNHAAQSSAA